jgi:hypothetical protein
MLPTFTATKMDLSFVSNFGRFSRLSNAEYVGPVGTG